MKNIAIASRSVTERSRLGGYFSSKVQYEVITDYTPKKLEFFKSYINKGKKIKYDVKEFNIKTIEGKKAYINFLLNLGTADLNASNFLNEQREKLLNFTD